MSEVIANRPVPQDDGRADHLPGLQIPALSLPSTLGGTLDIATAARSGQLVVYVYPRTGNAETFHTLAPWLDGGLLGP